MHSTAELLNEAVIKAVTVAASASAAAVAAAAVGLS